MKIAVLGASGFIAGRLIDRLLRDSAVTVIAGVRNPARVRPRDRLATRRIEASDPRSIDAALAGADYAINCIMGSAEAMIGTTRHIMNAASTHGVRRVIHFSSIAVFGAQQGQISEDAEHLATDAYGLAKVQCETLVDAARSAGLDVVTLRPALVYGPGSSLWTERIARLLRASRLGDLAEMGDGWCELIHVEEVVAATIAALTMPGIGGTAFNLGNPEPPTWNEYLMHYARALGAVPVRRIPSWQLKLERKLAAPFLKLAEMGAGRIGLASVIPPPITPGLAQLFDRRSRYDSGRADILLQGARIDWRQAVVDIANGARK